jgi:hypothetical protein
LSRHETLQQAAAAAGHRLCQRCSKKAAQLQARAEALAAELQALEEETAAEAALTAEALADPAEQPAVLVNLSRRRRAEIAAGFMPDLDPEAAAVEHAAEADLNARLAAVMAEADPESEAGQAWHAAQQAAEAEKQAAARAETLARFDAAGITAEAAAAADLQRQAEALAAITAALPTAEESRQAAVSAYVAEQPAGQPVTVPCQCEHASCRHAYLSVPAGNAAAMFVGPICDACVSHMQGYLLQGTEAEAITEEVRSMYRAQQQAAEALAAAEAAAAEALADYPTVERFLISAHVYLEDRGYAVERTIRRNIARADLLQAFSRLAAEPQLSKLAAYADGFG